MKAPARWSGHQQNTDSLSLESGATPHAALGKGGSPASPKKKPIIWPKPKHECPPARSCGSLTRSSPSAGGRGRRPPAPAGGGGKSQQFDIHRPYNGRGPRLRPLCPPGEPNFGATLPQTRAAALPSPEWLQTPAGAREMAPPNLPPLAQDLSPSPRSPDPSDRGSYGWTAPEASGHGPPSPGSSPGAH